MEYTLESLTQEICKLVGNGDHDYNARMFNGKIQLVQINDDESETVVGLVVVEYGSLHNGFNLFLQTGELHNVHVFSFDLGSKISMQMHAHRYEKNTGTAPDMQHWCVERIKQRVVDLNTVLDLLEPYINALHEPEDLAEALSEARKLFTIPYTVNYALGLEPDSDEIEEDLIEDDLYFFGVSSRVRDEEDDDEIEDDDDDDVEIPHRMIDDEPEDDEDDEEEEEDEEPEYDDEQKFLIDEKTDMLMNIPSAALARMAAYFGISDGGTYGLRRRTLFINELAVQPRNELKNAFFEAGASCWKAPLTDLESNPFQV